MDIKHNNMIFTPTEQKAQLAPGMPLEQAPEALMNLNAAIERMSLEAEYASTSRLPDDRRQVADLRRDVNILQLTAAQINNLVAPVEMTLEDELARFRFSN